MGGMDGSPSLPLFLSTFLGQGFRTNLRQQSELFPSLRGKLRRAEPQKALQGFIRNSIQVTRRDRRIRGPLSNLPHQRRPGLDANKKEHQNRGQPDPGRHHGDATSRPDIQPSGSAPAGQRLTESWNGLLRDRIHPRLNWMRQRRSGRPSWKASSREESSRGTGRRINRKKSARPALGTPVKGLQSAPACSLTLKLSKQ